MDSRKHTSVAVPTAMDGPIYAHRSFTSRGRTQSPQNLSYARTKPVANGACLSLCLLDWVYEYDNTDHVTDMAMENT